MTPKTLNSLHPKPYEVFKETPASRAGSQLSDEVKEKLITWSLIQGRKGLGFRVPGRDV